AEDGIRAFHVTGVQTCALPISRARPRSRRTAIPAVATVTAPAATPAATSAGSETRSPLPRATTTHESPHTIAAPIASRPRVHTAEATPATPARARAATAQASAVVDAAAAAGSSVPAMTTANTLAIVATVTQPR